MTTSQQFIAAVLLAAMAVLLPGTAQADDPPGLEVLAPGVISTGAIEAAATLTPDGQLLVFSRRAGSWGGDSQPARLYESQRTPAGWSEPQVLPFSRGEGDDDPSFSPDGRWLYFTSRRPVGGVPRADEDIWVVERRAGGWGGPRHLGNIVNSPAREWSPSVTAHGSLYFASAREGGHGQGDLYVARRKDGGYEQPENLGPAINGAGGEWNVHVTPDERLLLFEASGRATNRSAAGDLYVSERRGDQWTAPVALAPLNTRESELNARLTPDGRSLLFARSVPAADGSRHADLFLVPAQAVLPQLAAPAAARLVAVSRSAHEIVVIEAGSWRPLARHAVGAGPHELALSPDGRQAYTADYGLYPEPHEVPVGPAMPRWRDAPSGTVTQISLADGRRRSLAVPDCTRNHAILVSREGRRLWTSCEQEGTVREMDIASGRVTRSWATATGSHQLVVTADERLLVAANIQAGSVSLIDLATDRVETLATGRGAEGLALSPDGRWLWVGNAIEDTISVIDLQRRELTATFPSGGRFPVKLAFAADGRSVWVVNTFSRSLAVFDAQSHALLRSREFETPPLGLLLPPAGGQVIVTFPRQNEVAVLDATSAEVLARVPGVMEADGLAWRAASPPPQPAAYNGRDAFTSEVGAMEPGNGDYLFDYGDLVLRVRYLSASRLAWEQVEGPERGTRGEQDFQSVTIRPGVYFLWWQEPDRSTVSQVLDLVQGRVYTTWTGPDQTLAAFQGQVRQAD